MNGAFEAAAKRSPLSRLMAVDIRALRKARGLTLTAIAARLGKSVGWASQVERGLSRPTLADLRAFAEMFKVPVSLFLHPEEQVISEEEQGTIVRAGHRRSLGTSEGHAEELLSPDLGGSFAMLRSEFAPGSELGVAVHRQAEESGFVVSGRFEIEIDGTWHRLGEGDSFRFKGKPFRWRNPGKTAAILVWVTSPSIY